MSSAFFAGLGVAALLLSFGVLAAGRLRPALYAAQCGVIALAALWQAALSPWPAAVAAVVTALVLAGQAAWLFPALGRAATAPAGAPVAMLGAALLLVAAATATAPAGATASLAIVLLGLLGAAVGTGPFGVLCLLNGAALALLGVPGLPLQPVMALTLAGLAVLSAGDGADWRASLARWRR